MRVKFKQKEDIADFAQELKASFTPRDARPPPPFANLELVAEEGQPDFITVHGHRYSVPPIDIKDGARLLSWQAEIATAMQGPAPSAEEYFVLANKVTRLFYRLAVPEGKLRWFLWKLKLLRNPWRLLTDEEIGRLADFFSRCRTMSADRRRLLDSQAQQAAKESIS